MSQIFKVTLLNNDKTVKKIYAFVGSRFDRNPEISGDLSTDFEFTFHCLEWLKNNEKLMKSCNLCSNREWDNT